MTGKQHLRSKFYPILENLVSSVPGAVGAIFTDEEGEAIELFGDIEDYALQVVGAYSATIYPMFSGENYGDAETVWFSCRRYSVVIRKIENYILTLVLKGRTYSMQLASSLGKALQEFAVESGLKALSSYTHT